MEIVEEEALEFPGMDDRLEEITKIPRVKREEYRPVPNWRDAGKSWHSREFWLGVGTTAAVTVSLITVGVLWPWVFAWENPPWYGWASLCVTLALWAVWLWAVSSSR